VYAAHYPALVRLAYLTTGSLAAAEDVAQEAFIEWFRRGDQVREPVAFLRRGGGVAVHVVGARAAGWNAATRGHHGAGLAAGRRHRGGAGPRCTSCRPGSARRSSCGFYLDLPEVQIAAALGCRPGTVKSRAAPGARRDQGGPR
jgi:hypothetical protein